MQVGGITVFSTLPCYVMHTSICVCTDNEFQFVVNDTKLQNLAPKVWKSKDCSVDEPLITFHFRVQYYVDNISLLKCVLPFLCTVRMLHFFTSWIWIIIFCIIVFFKLPNNYDDLASASLLAGLAWSANLPALFLLTGQFLSFSPHRVKFDREERTVAPPCQISLWSAQGCGFTAPKLKKMEFYQYNCP